MNSPTDAIISWFIKNQPEMKVEVRPAFEAEKLFEIIATGRYTIKANNGKKYGYELSIIIPPPTNNFSIPEVVCIDNKLYPSLERHILSNRKACLGTRFDIFKIIHKNRAFSYFAKEVIDPFVVWQLYYDAFGKPPPWGEREHGFIGELHSITDYLAKIWNLSSEQCFRMLTERKPKKRKKCFCGSKLQFRYCHGKYIYPLHRKFAEIKSMTAEEYMLEANKKIDELLLPFLRHIMYLPVDNQIINQKDS